MMQKLTCNDIGGQVSDVKVLDGKAYSIPRPVVHMRYTTRSVVGGVHYKLYLSRCWDITVCSCKAIQSGLLTGVALKVEEHLPAYRLLFVDGVASIL